MRTINYFQITKKCNNFWKVSFLVFFICKISFAVNAQENAEFKEFFSYVYNGMYFEYLGHDDASVYFFRAIKHNKEIQIKTNDIKTAALKSEITIKLSAQYSKSKILEYRFENGSIYILSMFFNQKHEKNYLFRESFDIKSGMSNSEIGRASCRERV